MPVSEVPSSPVDSIDPDPPRGGRERQPSLGWISLKAFGGGSCALLLDILLLPSSSIWSSTLTQYVVYMATGVVLLSLLNETKENPFRPVGITPYQVQVRAFFLGVGFSYGLRCILSDFSQPFGLYLCFLSFFHFSEFFVTSVTSLETLSLDSFLLNHSKEYGIAALASVLEFFVELYYLPGIKDAQTALYIGVLLCGIGELLRKWAMLTASRNFTHLVRDVKGEGQYLVTSGPYAICRHPGYAGWFWWSIGTQLVMLNPFCTIAYGLAVYKFFKGRIYYEEICLLSFFGLDYARYQRDVRKTGVPFVEGYTTLPSNWADSCEQVEQSDDSSSSSICNDDEN